MKCGDPLNLCQKTMNEDDDSIVLAFNTTTATTTTPAATTGTGTSGTTGTAATTPAEVYVPPSYFCFADISEDNRGDYGYYKFSNGEKKGGSDGQQALFMSALEYTWISDGDTTPEEKVFLGLPNTQKNQVWVNMDETLIQPFMMIPDDTIGEANLLGMDYDSVKFAVINLYYTKLADVKGYSASVRFDGEGIVLPIVLVLVAVMIMVAVVCWVKRDKLPCCKGGKKNMKDETEMKEQASKNKGPDTSMVPGKK